MTHVMRRGDADFDANSFINTTGDKVATKRPPKGASQTVEVPLTTFDDLLADHEGPIDFASIDVEGHELDLLDGFDLDRFRPRAILIEDHGEDDDSPIARHLHQRGYAHICWFAWNRLFVRLDDPELLARAREIFPNTLPLTGEG